MVFFLLQSWVADLSIILVNICMQKMDVVGGYYIDFGREIRILISELYFHINYSAFVRIFVAFNSKQFDKSILNSFLVYILINLHLFEYFVVFTLTPKLLQMSLDIFDWTTCGFWTINTYLGYWFDFSNPLFQLAFILYNWFDQCKNYSKLWTFNKKLRLILIYWL